MHFSDEKIHRKIDNSIFAKAILNYFTPAETCNKFPIDDTLTS